MRKQELLQQIVARLSEDLTLLTHAAKTAHAAATHEECLPDNKYDTTALDAYRQLELRDFAETSPIRLTALIDLEDADGQRRQVFLGPAAGGQKLVSGGQEIVVITPDSPLGRNLLGKRIGDEVDIGLKALTIENIS